MRPYSMTIADACRWSGLGRTKLYELIASQQISAVKVGSRTLVVADAFEKYLAEQPKLHPTS